MSPFNPLNSPQTYQQGLSKEEVTVLLESVIESNQKDSNNLVGKGNESKIKEKKALIAQLKERLRVVRNYKD